MWNTHTHTHTHTPLTFRPVPRSGQIAGPIDRFAVLSHSPYALVCFSLFSSPPSFLLDRLTDDDAQSGTFQGNRKRRRKRRKGRNKKKKKKKPTLRTPRGQKKKGINELQKLQDTRSIIARCRMQPGARDGASRRGRRRCKSPSTSTST